MLTQFRAVAAASIILVMNAAHGASPLWELGRADNNNNEFALAPRDATKFTRDGFFVVGQSQAQQDWPYVHPGPADVWAGSRSHTFTILFGLKGAPGSGECALVLDLLDTHAALPPKLRVTINGRVFEKQMPRGTGDETVRGAPAKGREYVWTIPFAAELLRHGDNEINLTTLSGSWMLYDSVRLDAPAGGDLAPVTPKTTLISARVPPVWVRKGAQAAQPVHVELRHVGEAAPIVFRIADRDVARTNIRTGPQMIELHAPIAERSNSVPLSLLDANGNILTTTNLILGPPPLREIWMLPHSHVDIGYTHRQEDVVQAQISHLEKSMALADASSTNSPGMRFKWNPEAVWSLDHFLQRATPEKREQFLKAVRRGDVGVDALYGNMLTALCRPEELAQCLSFGAKISNLTGVPITSASICDVPGWTWGIVPMMSQAGVKYFAIGPNHADRVGTIHVWDNKPFYWKSQSGRERLLCWVVDNYHHFGNLEEHVVAHIDKLQQVQFPYDTSFLFWVGRWPDGSVDNAPPDDLTAEKVVAWNAKYAAPRVVIGLASEFFRAFEEKNGKRLSEFSGDLTPYWEDGAASTARETAINRASAERLSQASALFAIRRLNYPADRFEAAWKNVLLYSEHTWGAHNSISDPDNPFVLDQWRVKQAFALDAEKKSRALLAEALQKTETADAIDVFNTTQWPRTDLVVLPPRFAAESLLDERGKAQSTQRLSSGELVFLARDVPAFGAKRFRISSQSVVAGSHVKAEGNFLRTSDLSVGIDPQSGAIRSLRLRGLDRDFVNANAPVALNDFRYVLGTNAGAALTNGPVKILVSDSGPLLVALRIESEAPGCNRLNREVRIVDGLDRIEIIDHVDRKAVRKKDAVHFGFGFNVPGGKIRMETPWAVVRPNVDQLQGANRNWFTVQRWVDVSNARFGITWAPLDAPLMQLGGMTANLLGQVALHEWLSNAIDSQTIYSWAQNNHWHTNYKIDQPGVTTFRFLLRPHRDGFSAMDSARFGLETTRPLLVAAAVGETPGTLLALASNDVLIETLKVTEDGKGIIIRLFGVSGERQTARLRWKSFTPTSIAFTDLTEKPLRKAGESIDVPAYGVVSVRLDR